MGRRKFTDSPVSKKISIRESLIEQVDAQLLDPLSDEPAYGSWSKLVEMLVAGWLEGKYEVPSFPLRTLNLDDLLGATDATRTPDKAAG